jgi:dsDNA-specific endonuclease/ATPase MutS2
MAQHSSHILEMARKGAEHRYDELKAEIASLVKHFPHLTARAAKGVASVAAKGRTAIDAEVTQVRRRARQMSAAARKAVSRRMKKYWATRRKEQETKETTRRVTTSR